jgi:hypothetical protein
VAPGGFGEHRVGVVFDLVKEARRTDVDEPRLQKRRSWCDECFGVHEKRLARSGAVVPLHLKRKDEGAESAQEEGEGDSTDGNSVCVQELRLPTHEEKS